VLASLFFGVCVYVYILYVNNNVGYCYFFGSNFLEVFSLKNMISTARKKFDGKMNLIHYISKYVYLELPDIYNKFHQVAKI
jgi:hypothetical protein